VAHLSEGTLRRMVDDPEAHAGADARHYESCPECQARYKRWPAMQRTSAACLPHRT